MKEKVFKVLLGRARSEILKEYNPDSCIVSTAVCCDVFRYFGIKVEPLPCRALIFNPAMIQCVNKFGWPEDNDVVKRWAKQYGAWSIGVGFPRHAFDTGYVGHLVALVDGTEIIDLSLDQANRPQFKMIFSPVRVPVTEDFLTKRERLTYIFQNGCAVGYEQIANHGYTQSPDWYKKGRRYNIVRTLIEMIE